MLCQVHTDCLLGTIKDESSLGDDFYMNVVFQIPNTLIVFGHDLGLIVYIYRHDFQEPFLTLTD